MPVVPATQEAIRHAAEALARGDIVAFPTETVYGLGANALDARAVAKVFAAKERPRFNPLIVHVPGLGEAEKYAVVTDTARMLAQAFWPGPLSLVLKKRPACGIVDLVSAGLETIALRAPAHPVAQALLADGAASHRRAERQSLGSDQSHHCGPCRGRARRPAGHDPRRGPLPARHRVRRWSPCWATQPALLRPGALAREAIELVLGAPLAAAAANHRGASPGQLETHYAPATPLRLGAASVAPDEALLAFGGADTGRVRAPLSISARAAISKRLRPSCSRRSETSTGPAPRRSP